MTSSSHNPALAPIGDRLTGVGIPGDLLYPDHSVREWTQAAVDSADLPAVSRLVFIRRSAGVA